jgi:hypothetical protein
MQMGPHDLTNQQLLTALSEQLGVITDAMATKDDLKNFITKEDAKAFATKQDLKNFITKEDAKAFATKDDLKAFATKQDLTELRTGLESKMATKDDLKAMATKQDLVQLRVGLETRMDDLEGRMATKDDLRQMETRLTRKLDSHKVASVHHHLLTRSMIGDVNRQITHVREGLRQAADGAT